MAPRRGFPYGGIEFTPFPGADLLLVGDETAVPAICTVLEQLPADATGTAFLEVPVAGDVQAVRSPAGVENVTFEGLRCSGEYRVYAVGQAGGGWSGRPGQWRPVPRDARLGQNALMRRYFCPARNTAVQDAREAAAALRGGGHPSRTLEQN